MFIYIILLVVINLLFLINKNNNKRVALFLSFVLITLVACLRKYTVGVDTLQFYKKYIDIGLMNSWDYTELRFEPGFFYLCKILNMFSEDPQLLIIFTSVFINFSVYCFIKKFSKNYFLSTIFYLLMNIFFSYMNIMRQAMAIAVLLYGFKYLCEKKYLKYVLVVVLAAQFHMAAWASLLIVVILVLPNRKSMYYVLFVAAVVMFMVYNKAFSILSSIFGHSGYADSEFGQSNYFGALIVFFEAVVVFGVNYIYLILNKRKEFFKDKKIYILNIITILYMIFLLLVMRMTIFNRISGVFSIYCVLTIPELLMEIKKVNQGDYYILKWFSILIYFSSFIIIGIYRPEWFGCIPYEFFWVL